MNKLKELRKAKGLTQRELAKHLGVTQGALSSWESERYSIGNGDLKKIADFFGVTTDYILCRAGPDYEKPLDDPNIQEIADLYKKLSDDKKELVLAMARAMVND